MSCKMVVYGLQANSDQVMQFNSILKVYPDDDKMR